MRQRLAIIGTAIGCVLSAGAGSAAASTAPGAAVTTTKVVGLAGYHLRVRQASSLTVRGSVTVPTATCTGTKTKSYQLQINAGYKVGGVTEVAAVLLHLSCRAGKAQPGVAELDAGVHAKMPRTQIKPGQTVTIKITVDAGAATARITYPDHTTARVSDVGGAPAGAAYALTLANRKVPAYAPVAFRSCSVNGKALDAYALKAWESTTKGGTVDGQVSPVTDNTKQTESAFSITH